MIERDHRIDALRAIGTMLVILAHMSLPELVLNIRTFDVILLVMVSYMTFRLTNSESMPYLEYIWKRIKRLVIPTYVMLMVFFSLSEVISLAIQGSHAFELQTVVCSFLFLDSGIPYIWIVRIFVVIAFFAPLNSNLAASIDTRMDKCRIGAITFISLIIVSGGGKFILDFCSSENSILSSIITSWIVYPLIYIAITQLISIFLIMNQRWQIILSIVLCFTFVAVYIYHGSFNPDDYKSPPQLYWVVYGLAISFLFYISIPNACCSFLGFVSKNSLNIYLIHIIVLMFYNKALSIIDSSLVVDSVLSIWYIKYVMIFGASCLLVFLWSTYKSKLKLVKKQVYYCIQKILAK